MGSQMGGRAEQLDTHTTPIDHLHPLKTFLKEKRAISMDYE